VNKVKRWYLLIIFIFRFTTIITLAEIPVFNNDTQDDSLNILFVIPELKGSFKFDGSVDDPCWDNLKPVKLVMHIPTFGNEPSEKTEIYLAHDNDYIYAVGRFFDTEPDKIGVNSRLRDNISA
jgi:hypothetical protein